MNQNPWPNAIQGLKPRGLYNPMNYCYRNVAYQTLMNMPGFVTWVSHHQPSLCPRWTAKESEFCAACELHFMRFRYWRVRDENSTVRKARVERVNREINKVANKDRRPYPQLTLQDAAGLEDVNAQQDAAEFLRFLIGDIFTDFEQGTLQPAGFDQLFCYQQIECFPCQGTDRTHLRLRERSVVPLQLPIAATHNGNAWTDQHLLGYLNEHVFDLQQSRSHDDCEHCKKAKDCHIDIFLRNAPQYLILELSAMDYDKETFEPKKVASDVWLPLAMNFTNSTDPKRKLYYKLITTAFHEGSSMIAGHYVAATTGPDGKFYAISDEYVEETDRDRLQSMTYLDGKPQPYLVTYAQCSEAEFEELDAIDNLFVDAEEHLTGTEQPIASTEAEEQAVSAEQPTTDTEDAMYDATAQETWQWGF